MRLNPGRSGQGPQTCQVAVTQGGTAGQHHSHPKLRAPQPPAALHTRLSSLVQALNSTGRQREGQSLLHKGTKCCPRGLQGQQWTPAHAGCCEGSHPQPLHAY